MTIKRFLKENREEIDAAILRANPTQQYFNDGERLGWLRNDESLYLWALDAGVNL